MKLLNKTNTEVEQSLEATGVKSRKDCGKMPVRERMTIGVELTINVSF